MLNLEGNWDYTRCQRPNGKIYGSPNRCRPPAVEIGPKEEQPAAAGLHKGSKRIRIGRTVQQLGVNDLEKLLKDPRLKPHQKKKVEELISKKKVAVSKAKPKSETEAKKEDRPDLSAEEKKTRKKYREVDAELKRIEAIEQAVKKEVKEKTGQEPYPGSKSYKEYQVALAERGVRDDASMKLRQKRDQYLTPSLKAEIQAEAIAKNQADWKAMTREEKRTVLKERVERFANKNYSQKDIQELIDSYHGFLRTTPGADTPTNRLELMAARAYRARLSAKSREEERLRSASVEGNLRNSPKYTEIPGSSRPMSKVDVQSYKKDLEKESEARERRAKELEEKGERWAANNERQLATAARVRASMLENGYTGNPDLARIYKEQGFNARPEAVATRKDLEGRKDLVTGDDGKPLILWRGVTTPEFADQFKGWGPDGGTHFAGQGVYGNGTYAASAAPGSQNPSAAKSEAKGYAGESRDLDRKVTAFGIRKDANIVQFEGENWRVRDARYRQWHRETVEKAEKATGYTFNDIGEAAAALGIHAYRVPQGRDEDFWVILNRGALVVAGDPQLDSFD